MLMNNNPPAPTPAYSYKRANRRKVLFFMDLQITKVQDSYMFSCTLPFTFIFSFCLGAVFYRLEKKT